MPIKLKPEMIFSNKVAYFIKKHVKDRVDVSITNNTLVVLITPENAPLFTFRMLFADEHVRRDDAEELAMDAIEEYREHVLKLHFR